MMRGGGNVDSVPAKHGEKANIINSVNNNNNNSFTSSGVNSNKKSKHSESKSKKINGKSANNDSFDPTTEAASAPVSRKNSRLSFFTKGSSKHSSKNNTNANESQIDMTKNSQTGNLTGTTTATTASTSMSTASQSLIKIPLTLPSAKNKTKESGSVNNNNICRTPVDSTSAGTVNDSMNSSNININININNNTDQQESESASAIEQAIASRPTLTIITDLDDEMEYNGDVVEEGNMYHTNIINKNSSNMASIHDNEHITHTTSSSSAAAIQNPSPHDTIRFPSKSNSLLDLTRMSNSNNNNQNYHSRYPSSINLVNSAYPIASAHDTTHPIGESNMNDHSHQNIMSPSPNSALPNLPYLPPIDESDPLHLNNLATSSFSNPHNNNNNLNTILFHGVSTASSHSSNPNASLHDYPPKSAHSTRNELPRLLDVSHMNSNSYINSNNGSGHSIGSHNPHSHHPHSHSHHGKYSTRLLEPTNNENNATSTTSREVKSRFMSRCPTMESIPEMRSSCHRLTATPIVPINAFVDHEARRRTALEMQRRFGGNSYGGNSNNNNNSTRVDEPVANDTSNANKDLNNTSSTTNNNDNNSKTQSINSAKSAVLDVLPGPNKTSVNNQGNVNDKIENNNNNKSAKGDNNKESLLSKTQSMVLLSNTETKESVKSNTNKAAPSTQNNNNNNSSSNVIDPTKKKDKVEKSAKATDKKNDTQVKESVNKLYKSPITLNMCPRNAGKAKDYKLHPSVVNAVAVRAEAQRQAREKIIRIGAQRLQERLNELHLVTYRIKHDGNCQFRAIAQQLLGSEDYDDMIRSHVLSYMKRVRAKCFDYYFESPKAADAYFDKLSKPGS